MDAGDGRGFQLFRETAVSQDKAGSASAIERYELEEGGYALYIERTRLFVTPTVGILVDPAACILVTHGPPRVVREEFDALREMGSTAAGQGSGGLPGCVLLEGSPPLEVLNEALRGGPAIADLCACLARENRPAAERVAQALLYRARRSR
jgi:hypothetical protein